MRTHSSVTYVPCVCARLKNMSWGDGDKGAIRSHPLAPSIIALERESEGREDGVSSEPVFDVELMEPPGAEVDLLGPCLERIAEQRPDGRHASPESAELVARAVVIRHLLREKAANARGKAQRKMLIDRPFEMQLGAALVICRRVGRVERQAKRASDLETGLQTKVRIGPPEIEGGAVQARLHQPVGNKVSRRGEAGQDHVPMLLARMPAEDGAVFGVRDAEDVTGAAKPLGRVHGCGDGEIRCSPLRAEWNRHGEARVGAEKLKIRKPASDRDVGDDILGDPRAALEAIAGEKITAALIKNKRVPEINARWRCVTRHREGEAKNIFAAAKLRGFCRLDHGQASGDTNCAGDRSHGGPCRHRAEPLGAQSLGASPSN